MMYMRHRCKGCTAVSASPSIGAFRFSGLVLERDLRFIILGFNGSRRNWSELVVGIYNVFMSDGSTDGSIPSNGMLSSLEF